MLLFLWTIIVWNFLGVLVYFFCVFAAYSVEPLVEDGAFPALRVSCSVYTMPFVFIDPYFKEDHVFHA